MVIQPIAWDYVPVITEGSVTNLIRPSAPPTDLAQRALDRAENELAFLARTDTLSATQGAWLTALEEHAIQTTDNTPRALTPILERLDGLTGDVEREQTNFPREPDPAPNFDPGAFVDPAPPE